MRRENYTPHVPRQTEKIVWIPYGELQPPECRHYLVTIKFQQHPKPEIRIAYWNNGWSGIGGLVTSTTVIAFAHLPTPYKEN